MKTKQLLLIFLLAAALLPWAATAQTPNLYTSYTATVGTGGTGNEGYPKLVDNNINTKWCVGGFSGPNNLGLYIEFQSTDPIIPTGYVLTTANDNASYPGRNPKDWTIKAKANPNDEWTTIASVTDDQVLQDVNLTDFEFTVNNTNLASYQYFRFDVTAIQSGGCFQLAELRFNAAIIGPTYLYTSYTATAGVTDNQSEGYPYLVDNNVNTKWCIGGFSGPNNLGLYIEFYSAEPIIPVGYVLTTANDNSTWTGRNPKDWTIKAKANPNDEWTTIASVTDDQVLQDVNFTDFAFMVNNPNLMSYQYFRFDVTAIQSGGCFQLAELKFMVADSCRTPVNFTVSNLTATTADLSWGASMPTDSYTVKYKQVPEGEWQTANVAGGDTQMSTTLTGLAPDTPYEAYVYPDCNPEKASQTVNFTTAEPCPAPVNLFVSNVSLTSANIEWRSDPLVDSYTVEYRTAQTKNASFTEGFEHGLGDWTLRDCASGTGVFADANHSGRFGFCFVYTPNNPLQYLISPELTGVGEGMSLEFYYMKDNNAYVTSFQVGFSTTDNATESFTFGDEIVTYDRWWHVYSQPIPSGTKYICLKQHTDYAFSFYIDDIAVNTEVPAGEWQTANVAGGNTQVSTTLTGLVPDTPYEAYVYPDCNPEKVSQTVSFTTADPCPEPFNLTISNVTSSSARIEWTCDSLVNSCTMEYRPASTILRESFENGIGNWTLRDTNSNSQIMEGWGHAGNNAFRFYIPASDPTQYLISPELPSTTPGMTLQFYYKSYSGGQLTFQIGFSSTDNETESFTFGEEITVNEDGWHLYSESIPAKTKYICWKCPSSSGWRALYIDDIVVSTEVISEWQTANVAGGNTQVSTTLTDLRPETIYEAYVYPDCNPDKVSETLYFTTEGPLHAFDFESGCDWTLVNGNLTNQWTWGTAAHNGTGTHGLYISNDGGTTNAYNNTSNTMVYAYKTLNFEAEDYSFSYDWLANGETNWDFLRVALVPASVNLAAGTAMPSGFDYNALPAGWIALDGGSKLNMATDWQTASYEAKVPTAGEYNMVFAWCNDQGLGTNPPAAIDNVFIGLAACSTPVNLTVSNLTATSADLSWSASTPTDSYTVNYRKAESLDAIFTEGFEDGLGDWTRRDYTSNTGISSDGAHSGSFGFRFHYNLNPPQYLISPELSGVGEGAKLEFYYKNRSSQYPETFQVGYSTTDNETYSFIFGDEITASDGEWHLYSETIPAGTKYICWKYNSYDQYELFIDDIVVSTKVWQTATVAGNATEVSTTLTGLTPATLYEAYVYPDCNPDKVSDTVRFTTETGSVFSIAIAGYGTTDGKWHLIATPLAAEINPTDVTNMTNGNYDLYRFNQSEQLEWENWKQEGDHYHFNLESGRGYLYANSADDTLVFCGTPYSGNGQVTLSKDNNAPLGQWNLIGNPLGTNATLGAKPFYIMNEAGTEIIAADNDHRVIAPMQGIFVEADSNGETVTFSTSAKGTDNEASIVLNLSQNSAVIDRVIVRLGKGETLHKLQIRDGNPKVYISQNAEEYAIVSANGHGELPVHFKTNENGTYTLSAHLEGVEMEYLHLIDNLTGADIDLLQTTTYSFTAKTTDNESRFRLVFKR